MTLRPKPRPRLVVELELEGPGQIRLYAASREDEQRLRLWLRRSLVVAELSDSLERLLDGLDAEDAA